jgi:homoserine O-acetyltransferase/O-succinyltransferase
MHTMRGMRALIIFMFVLAIAASMGASNQTVPQPKEGAQQFATLHDLKLQNGTVIHDFRVGYRTLGKLNANESNAILWPTWLGGRSEDLPQFVGPGNVLDTGKYFVILVDSIGDGVSTSPSNSSSQPLMSFPRFTVRDMVNSQHRLLTEELHLSHLYAVIEISMGGLQTFEWSVAFPDFMDLAIPLSGSPQSTSSDKLLWTSEIDAIELDPAWNNGKPKGQLGHGIALAEEIDSMNSTSPTYRTTHTNINQFDAFLAGIRKNAKGDAGSVSDQIRQRQAILSFDIPGELHLSLAQVASHVHAKMLVIISPEDHMVNPGPAMAFASAIGAPVIRLDSPCGHLSYNCISVGPTVAQFLSSPSSVRNGTLTDASKP